MDSLLKELLKNGRILDFSKEYYKPLLEELKKLLREENKIESYQIGNMGDYGYCAFINQGYQIIVPCKNLYQLALAC